MEDKKLQEELNPVNQPMKLVLAIVNNDDSYSVSSSLTKAHFQATKLATTGGFLMAGNTTFIIGVQESRVEECIKVIKENSERRSQVVPSAPPFDMGFYTSFPLEVTVGGATIFVLDVEQFRKV